MSISRVRIKHCFTQLLISCVATCCLPISMAIAQPFGYAVNSDSRSSNDDIIDNLYLINLANGDAQRIGNVGFLDVEGLAFSPEGNLFGADDESNSLIQINTETGAGASVGGQTNNLQLDPTQLFDFGLTFSCTDDMALLSSDNMLQLLSADLADDARATVIGGTSNIPITGLATLINGDDEQIFGLGSGTSPGLYQIDRFSGSATLIGQLQNAAPYSDAGIAFDEEGQLWAITDRSSVSSDSLPSQILQIDIDTGIATVIAETIDGIESLAISAPDCDGMNGTVGGTDPAVDVPVLDIISLIMMALVLLTFAGYHLRRSR